MTDSAARSGWSDPGWDPPAAPEPDASVEPASLVVRVDTGEQIHYLDWGAPEGDPVLPPLLLVHGIAATSWSWAPVARRLCSLTRVLAVDLRGHGLSDAPRTGYGLDSLAYDALTVLAGSGFAPAPTGAPAVAAGHGLGALVVAAAAGAEADALCGLALVDGGWEDLAEATGQNAAEFLRGMAEPPEVLRSMEAYLADRREYDPPSWDADQERAARSAVEQKHAGHVMPVAGRHTLAGCVEAMFGYEPAAILPSLEVPLLIAVAGSAGGDDALERERDLALQDVLRARARAAAPATRVAHFPGSGHNLMRYRPDALAAELLALLRVAGTRSSLDPTSDRRRGAPA